MIAPLEPSPFELNRLRAQWLRRALLLSAARADRRFGRAPDRRSVSPPVHYALNFLVPEFLNVHVPKFR